MSDWMQHVYNPMISADSVDHPLKNEYLDHFRTAIFDEYWHDLIICMQF